MNENGKLIRLQNLNVERITEVRFLGKLSTIDRDSLVPSPSRYFKSGSVIIKA